MANANLQQIPAKSTKLTVEKEKTAPDVPGRLVLLIRQDI